MPQIQITVHWLSYRVEAKKLRPKQSFVYSIQYIERQKDAHGFTLATII